MLMGSRAHLNVSSWHGADQKPCPVMSDVGVRADIT
jgi:hypothetical protein